MTYTELERDPNEPPITILSIMEAVAKSGTQA